jgi:hypothetical protein
MSSLPSKQVNQEELDACAREASYVVKKAMRQLENLVTAIAVSWHADTEEAWSQGRVAILGAIDEVYQAHGKVKVWAEALTAFKPQTATTDQQFSLVETWAQYIAGGWEMVKVWACIHRIILEIYQIALKKDTAPWVYNYLLHAHLQAQTMYGEYCKIQGQILHMMSSEVIRELFTEYVGSQIRQKRQQITQLG